MKVEMGRAGNLIRIDVLAYDTTETRLSPRNTVQEPALKSIEIDRNYKTHADLGHKICLYIRAAFNFDGSRANLSLVESLQGDIHHPF